MANRAAQLKRFWSHVHKTRTCWLWIGSRSHSGRGYGQFWNGARLVHAHRWIFEHGRGETLPNKIFVCHRCDNPPCVRPDHLFAGTNSENGIDMVRKGRCWNCKLSAADVIGIRAMMGAGATSIEVARRFGVDPSHIRRVARGVSGKVVPLEAA